MKIKAGIVMVFALSMGLIFSLDTYGQDEKEKKSRKRVEKSLVRKDLLVSKTGTLSPPRRNIFTPQRSTVKRGGNTPESDGVRPPSGKAGNTKRGANQESFLNIKYIGYVNSEKRVIALLIFQGETYAVESGDILESGLVIGEITDDEVEIIGADSQTKRIPLEGE